MRPLPFSWFLGPRAHQPRRPTHGIPTEHVMGQGVVLFPVRCKCSHFTYVNCKEIFFACFTVKSRSLVVPLLQSLEGLYLEIRHAVAELLYSVVRVGSLLKGALRDRKDPLQVIPRTRVEIPI